jgi:UDP-N-acetylmuramoylalanine--D-glutamate ligase
MSMELAGRKVLVLGLGISGRSAAAFCAARGASVVAADERAADALPGLDSMAAAVDLRCGGPLPDPADFDLVVPSPGVPPARYAGRARQVAGDVELAGHFLAAPIVAVTGTNGKSTVTCLVEAMLRASGLRAEAAGNLGRPALDLVGRPLDAAVLEVSSFQLETTRDFAPRVAVILNLSPDHLDRHGDFAAYRDAKARILDNQTAEDAAVLFRDDPAVWSLAERCAGRVFAFGRSGPYPRGAWLDAGAIALRDDAREIRASLDGGELGGADRLNAAAALAASAALGADPQRAAAGLADFRSLPHRCEPVGMVDGVHFVNDSKATNPGAACAAMQRFAAPLVWIAGGRDKGLDFAPLADAARGRVRRALLLGEAAGRLERALGDAVPTERVGDLDAAVRRAVQLAQPGDVVLLSPACASFDQFRSFEERGEHYRRAVASLAGGER